MKTQPLLARVEELEATELAAFRVLREYGFFVWGHDSWCHDEPGIGCVRTAEALDLLLQDDRLVRRTPAGSSTVSEPPGDYWPLDPSFAAHASPQAIIAEMGRLQDQRREISRHIEALLLLRSDRIRQIEAGEWPVKEELSDEESESAEEARLRQRAEDLSGGFLG